MYELKYTLGINDYADYLKFYMGNDKVLKRFYKFSYFAVIPAFVLMFIPAVTDAASLPEALAAALTAAAFIMFFIMLKPILIWATKLEVRDMKKRKRFPFNENNLLRFNDGHFIETAPETATTKAIINYERIENVWISDTAVYLTLLYQPVFIIPLSAFESTEQLQKFIVFINQKRRGAHCASA